MQHQRALIASLIILALAASSCASPVTTARQALEPTVIPAVPGSEIPAITRQLREQYEAAGEKFAVSAQGKATTAAAMAIARKGGNLIDATIAASFAVSVERPHSTGIGGGGFMVFRDGKSKKVYAVDFRERAPKAASRDMYVTAEGKVAPRVSLDGALAAATPGLVAGLFEIHRRFGKLPWRLLLEPAIALAEKGIPVYPRLAEVIAARKEVLARFPASRAVFFKADGTPLATGETLIQKDLAETLKRIARDGRAGFYKGPVASAIAHEMGERGGLITTDDLAAYKVRWLEPLVGTYKNFTLFAMPPPSSGGVHVLQILNMLEHDHLRDNGFMSARNAHLTASAMQQAFADRAEYLGDPDFVKVPTAELISKSYAKRVRKLFTDKARRPDEVAPGNITSLDEHTETTHISLINDKGDMVATSQTINGWFGSALVVPGTGVLLNNEMDDFSALPGVPNLFGAVGKEANAIAPLKTPLSSMSPTLVLNEELKPLLSVGAPGGTRIISCVANVLLNYLEYETSLFDAITRPRLHHQWRPDVLSVDPPGFRRDVAAHLQSIGYNIEIEPIPCRVMGAAQEGKHVHGVSDPRDFGAADAF